MTNGNDLFPRDQRKPSNAKAIKSAAQLEADDQIVMSEIHELASASAIPVRLSTGKAIAVKALINKKTSIASSVAGVAVVLAVATASFTHLEHKSPQENVADSEVMAAPVHPSKVSSPEKDEDKAEINTNAPEIVALPPSPIGAQDALKEIANNDAAKPEMNQADQHKIDPKQEIPTIKIVDEPFEGPIPDKAEVSASSIIDQFGFGVEAPAAEKNLETSVNLPITHSPETAETDMDNDPERVNNDAPVQKAPSESSHTADTPTVQNVPVPTAKPAKVLGDINNEDQAVSYRIIDRKGEKSGFWRMRGNDAKTKQWFIVIEATDAQGKTFDVPVKSADTGKIKEVSKWAIEVSEKDFMAFSDELIKDKSIKNPVIGEAASKTSQPKWSVSTTGAMLTEW